MKKLLVGLSLLLTLTSTTVGLTACGDKGKVEHSHTYTTEVVEATCTEQGYTKHICECGNTYNDTYVDALDHNIENHDAKSPNCYEVGWNAYEACSRCSYSTYVEIPKIEHDWVSGYCSICNGEFYSKGLEFTLIKEETEYRVSRGTCVDDEVVIPSTYRELPVTTIDDSAFSDYSELVSITIPNTINNIGSSVFSACKSLKEIKVDDSNQKYSSQDGILYNKDKTKFVQVPLGITGSITLPNTVSVSSSTFKDCILLESILVDESNTKYSSEQGILYNKLKTSIVSVPKAISGSVIIPDTVQNIGERAFEKCTSLEEVILGNSVSRIESFAFNGCYLLESIIIPESVEEIEEFAFYNCNKLVEVINKSSNITITKGSYDNGYLGYYAFRVLNEEPAVNNFIYQNGLSFYEYDGKYYLMGYNGSNTEIVLPNDVNGNGYSIYKYAFYGNDTLTSVTIGENVTSIGYGAFNGCIALNEINYNATAMEDLSYYNDAFYNAGKDGVGITVTIGANVTKIPKHLFFQQGSSPKIISVAFEENSVCESIGGYAFRGCKSLTSISLPNSIQNIGPYAFYGCSSLTSIEIPGSVQVISSSVFENCDSLSVVILQDGIQTINSSAFYGCASLESIIIPDSVQEIKVSAFEMCNSLTKIYYNGTSSQWNDISIENENAYITNATVYYYSANEPTLNNDGTAYDGNYWYYENGVVTIWEK